MPSPIRPDQSCVPQDLQGAAAWVLNFVTQLQIVGAGLGFSVAELNQLKDDNKMVQFLAEAMVTVDSWRSSMIGFKNNVLTTPNGTPMADYPTFAGIVLPAADTAYAAGIWDRINHAIDQVRSHLSFNEELGGLLGVNPTHPDAPSPGDVKPTGKCDAAMHGYLFSAVVAGREQADQWQVWVRKAGSGSWELAATATGKSVDITFEPGEESGPIALEVYIQLRKGNANYGQPSDVILVTVNP